MHAASRPYTWSHLKKDALILLPGGLLAFAAQANIALPRVIAVEEHGQIDEMDRDMEWRLIVKVLPSTSTQNPSVHAWRERI